MQVTFLVFAGMPAPVPKKSSSITFPPKAGIQYLHSYRIHEDKVNVNSAEFSKKVKREQKKSNQMFALRTMNL